MEGGTMQQIVRFIDTPNGPIVVADAEPKVLGDEIYARKLRQSLCRALGNIPVLLRSQAGGSFSFNGDASLRRYAVDPTVDAMPAVGVDLDPPTRKAA
jgi:hypothetical protein